MRNTWLMALLLVLMALLAMLVTFLLPRAGGESGQVVVYTALDEEFSRPVFEEFTRQTGIEVLAKFDTESTKTVGLTQAILAERSRPRCDVFWNNEIVNTLRLDRARLLKQLDTPAAAAFPTQYRSSNATWFGLAARARVLVVNTDRVASDDIPTSIHDLVDPRWRDQVGIAKPLAGTTASHAACLFAVWGEERAKDFFRQLHNNARIMSGNRQVAQAVARGELAFGLTDTDDAIIELEKGWPVTIVYPDQGDGQLGTLFIPNTISIIEGSANQESARRLIDFLLSPTVERMLAAGPSAQIPLSRLVLSHLVLSHLVEERPRVESPQTVRAMQVDFEAAANEWNEAAHFLRDEFTRAR